MIQIAPQMRIFLLVEAVDFRKGIDGLSALCRRIHQSDPFSGYVFVFINRRRNAIRILSYDGQGFWLCHKRLSTGRFHWWPKPGDERITPLTAFQMQTLIWNQDPKNSKAAPMWKEI